MSLDTGLVRGTTSSWSDAVPPPYAPPAGASASSVRPGLLQAPGPHHPTPGEPDLPPAARGPLSMVQRIGAIVSVMGVLVCGFVAYELVVTDIVAGRSQALLRPRLADRFVVEQSLATTSDTASTVEDSRAAFGAATAEADGDEAASADAASADAASDDATAEITRRIEQPPVGEPIALLSIPEIDVEQVVVEGSGQNQLNVGPGHYRGSPLPGRVGNIVIAGRRTTYGAPFDSLGQLEQGDAINLSTGRGRFEYRVSAIDLVQVGEPDVVGEDGTNKLTLVTANSPFDATGRLVVTARLAAGDGDQPVAESDTVGAARLALPESELGLQRDSTAWAPAIIWSQALLGLVLAWRFLRRRWSPAALWIIGTPTLVAVVVVLYESVSRLLPATL